MSRGLLRSARRAGVIERQRIREYAKMLCSAGRLLISRGAMANPEISLAISATSFGLVIGFVAGYATRAYMSYVRRRSKD
jgi:hypothetical protein